MSLRTIARRARELVSRSIFEGEEPELERVLVSGAVVSREGDHYRIESGAESWEELEASARHRLGTCDCGAALSLTNSHQRCRVCGREYSL